ncbi:substrate-binding domain-containing protein [Phaeobacter sp. HF9A]|uniref:substrate-binding domain-containing protein n=1 Tax=Phaeobacter sp. HF9A TaxID=2721561 RepID=UPI0014314AF9|nr:substrate-binding domain-containing protein [Phaeobacter sp. HF9A]NIZ11964.1 ABC transporter substrate-binding protein [Phaeobacter sp. HF9A]
MSQPATSVLAPAAFASALNALAPEMEGVTFIYGPATGATPESITSRLQAGEQFDLVLLPEALVQAELSVGRLVGAPARVFASTVAFCVPEGAACPDLSTEAELSKALRAAATIGLSAAGSGKFFRDVLLPALGLAEAVSAKLHTITDRPVGRAVAEGQVALGFQQKAELLEVEGLTVIDDLADIARNDTWIAVARRPGSDAVAAKTLVDHIRSASARQSLLAHGLTPAN